MTLLQSSSPAMVGPPSLRPTTSVPEDIIKPWKLPPQKLYIFVNANVVNVVAGTILPRCDVEIEGGLIVSVARRSEAPAVRQGSIVVDASGKYICPGLIDCHVHLTSVPGSPTLSGAFARDSAISLLRQPFVVGQTLARGFTTVRDCGGATLALKEAIEDEVFPGPRLFIANAALSQTGGHGDKRVAHDHTKKEQRDFSGGVAICDGVPDCVYAAREQLRTGADFIKIMIGGGVASPTDRLENTQFLEEEIRAICEVADSYGSFVTAHGYTPTAIKRAVDNGVKGIEHGNFLDEETARLMAEQGVWLTPTLVTYDAMASDKYAGFLPPENQHKNMQVLERGLRSLEIAKAAKVQMCFGSDLLGPLAREQSREFSIRRKVLTDKEILQHATINPAKLLNMENFLGQVKEGFAADLLVLNANPLEDVTLLERPEAHLLAVIKNGRVYSSRWSRLPEDVFKARCLIE